MSAQSVVGGGQFVELVRLFITPFITLLITSFHDGAREDASRVVHNAARNVDRSVAL